MPASLTSRLDLVLVVDDLVERRHPVQRDDRRLFTHRITPPGPIRTGGEQSPTLQRQRLSRRAWIVAFGRASLLHPERHVGEPFE